jgi:hypothetical protein
LKLGIIFTEDYDVPVPFPNAIRILIATVNRIDRIGEISDPDQRVSPYVAHKSITICAVYLTFKKN